ncbi:MAG TPA: DUF308 domain-containing protein [Candidatus Limnocylindrales bacterium]|nr:DUF308 domain-containing protein [Candidatus Limnocylindrales bacterium]
MSFIAAPSDEALRGRWKWLVGIGVLLVVVGLIALWNVVDATLVTTIVVGIALLFGGAMQIVGTWASEGSTGRKLLMAVLGVLYIIIGFNLIADPLRGTVALTIAVALFLMVDGVLRIFSALVPETENKVLTIVFGILMIILGAWLWSGIPVTGIAIGFFVGLQLIIAGVAWIMIGWMSRSAHGDAASAQVPA